MVIRTPITDTEWHAYYLLRYEVLRKPLNQPIGSEKNEGDKTGIHFALFIENKIIAIGRLDVYNFNTVQPRFVAVNSNYQGKGYGIAIMNTLEKYAISKGYKYAQLAARDYAIKFYEKLDYKVTKKAHLLFGVLQHYTMLKKL